MAKKKAARTTTKKKAASRRSAVKPAKAPPSAASRAPRVRPGPPSPPSEPKPARRAGRVGPITVFTIGYQGRDGDEVIDRLREAGVDYLADIRAKPMSRNPEFRAGPLRRRCEAAGIEYGAWQSLGTPEPIRLRVKSTRDFATFHRDVRSNAIESMGEALDALGEIARERRVALLCLERAHDECHRADIADLLGERIGAEIRAIE